MLSLFGYNLVKPHEIQEAIDAAHSRGMRDGRDQIHHESGQALRHIRDLAHNIPFHLNFELPEEVEFCHQVISQAFRLTLGAQRVSMTYPSSGKLRAKLIGKSPVNFGGPLTPSDFDEAAQGNYERAAYIAKVIFSVNRPRYAKKGEWFDEVSGFIEEASMKTHGARHE